MDESPENVVKKLCCTCLSADRKLFQLYKLPDGVNNLYLLLSYDTEAYREGFYKDAASLLVCWECWATMRRVGRFRAQACAAQHSLAGIADGRVDMNAQHSGLSHLTHCHKSTYDHIVISEETTEDIADNFIDCGPVIDIIKSEDEIDDIPLSELNQNHSDCTDDDSKKVIKTSVKQDIVETHLEKKPFKRKKKSKIHKAKANSILDNSNSREYYTTSIMSEETCESREKRKLEPDYVDAPFKCESCVIGFKTQIALDGHNIVDHTKTQRRTPQVVKPGSKPRRNQAMRDQRTPFGYMCPECNKYFDNKNKRWKHVQRWHREGFRCHACGKRFAFKNNLTRHLQVHASPAAREECPTCHKLVRCDLARVHARIHAPRAPHACAACDKHFASRASYEHHLKYTQAHAPGDVLKYKCSKCDKGYRSRGELRDHVNYQHMGRTQHKCPICGKALATPRCITRHVRRAHDGVKESPRDKICQQCGKAFRDKKGLREHEFIHTGERPLSCEICGCTFRQSASLYTHRKRVHKIYPQRRTVALLDATEAAAGT